jgi:hypothetical protein
MYLFQSIHRGFFTQYYLEVLLPCILLAAWFLARIVADKKWCGRLLVVLIFFVLAMAAGRFLGAATPMYIVLFAAAAALVATLLFLRKNSTFEQRTGYGLLLWGGIVMALYSGNKIGPRYECIWSPATLQQVCVTLQKEGKDATVLSGTTIWAFASGLTPYQNIAHPTELMRKFSQNWSDSFTQTPPDYIILDGYTQRKYTRYWKLIEDELKARYELMATIADSRYPVQVYRLTIKPPPSESTFAGALCP